MRLIRLKMPVALCLTGLLFLASACSQDTDARLAEIRALESSGRIGESIRALHALLEDDEDHPQANYMLGRILVQNERPAQAVSPLRRAAASEAFAKPAGLLLASTLFQSRAYDLAIDTANGLLETDPQNLSALLLRGKSQLAARQPELALSDANAILSQDPSFQNALTLKGSALVDLGRRDDAESVWLDLQKRAVADGRPTDAARACSQLAVFYRSQKEFDRVEDVLNECLAAHPSDMLVQQVASEFFISQGQDDRVLEIHEKAVEESPDDLRIWSRLSNLHRAAGRLPDALKTLEQGLARVPEPAEAFRYAHAELLMESGDLAAAREIRDTLSNETYRQLIDGSIALRTGDPKTALEKFDAGLKQWPNNSAAHYMAGEAARRLGDGERANKEYREAIRLADSATDSALKLAQIEFSAGNYRRSLSWARFQIGHRPFANASAHRIAIRSALEIGETEQASQIAEALRAASPNSIEWIVESAEIERRATGAADASQFILSHTPDLAAPESESLLRDLVSDFGQLGRDQESLKWINSALERDADRTSLHDLRARVMIALGRIDDAEKAYQRAIELDDQFAPAYATKALIEIQRKNPKGAIVALGEASAADPANSDFAYAAATIARQSGDEAATLSSLEQVLARRPGHVAAANDLAWILATKKTDLDRALRLAQFSTQRDRSPNSLDTLGWVRHQRAEYDAAISIFEVALDEGNPKPAIRYRLALSLGALGKFEEARSVLQEIISGPAFPEVDQAQSELERIKNLEDS